MPKPFMRTYKPHYSPPYDDERAETPEPPDPDAPSDPDDDTGDLPEEAPPPPKVTARRPPAPTKPAPTPQAARAPQPPDPVEPREPTVEELRERVRASKAKKLTGEEIDELQRLYADVARATDDDAKSIKRAVIAKLRRVTHEELHPACRRVTFTVPWHPTSDPRLGRFTPYRINEVPYHGVCELWTCEAQQLAWAIEEASRVEALRMTDNGTTVDLDNPVAHRIRQIQEA